MRISDWSADVCSADLRERLEAITGSSGAARSEMAYLTAQADRLGVALNKSADNYTNLEAATRGTQLEGQLTRDTFEALTEASSKMNLEAQQTDQVFDAVEKIIAKKDRKSTRLNSSH